MSVRLAIVAEPAAAAIAGLDGSFEWGDATTVAPGTARGEAEVVVALGAAEAGEPDVRLDGLWSRAAWPVRDDLFELDPPDPGGALLVVTTDEERDATLLEKLAERGVPAEVVPELSPEVLAGAAAVAFPPDVDADGDYVPGRRQEAVPGSAFAPLAAGRPAIVPRAAVTFGLHAGVDHLGASTDDDVVQWADILRAFPEAFVPQVALGRIAAERQRASVVYGRLVADVAADGPA